ncbi:MAG: PAS domain-containing protein [Acidobacteria bacterium]|nr:PAS domain-containing protein [Acidobacteriota bacterium]
MTEENESSEVLETSDSPIGEVSSKGENTDPMLVAIGASAGGVEALQELFGAMPAEPGLTFLVMLHTAPEPDGRLSEVIQRKTSIPVTAPRRSAKLRMNHIYCLPCDRELELLQGEVLVTERKFDMDRSAAIDLLFRSVAGIYKERAISVLLSGTGADGSLGTGRIREEGGVNIVQDPGQAQYPSMPRSAIEQGSVDFVLPLEQIPNKLVSLRQNAERIQLPPEKEATRTLSENALIEILALLRARTRHDFLGYKRSTVLRRIERRMQITECEDLTEYLMHLRQHPEEVQGLLRDLLISVTSFFRDPQAFRQLESEIVPRLFAEIKSGGQIRVWVPGCATGEEAYSQAMILTEFAETLNQPPSLQIFATDIDESALAAGRSGLYPHTISADVSEQRLRRFFSNDGASYRVKRELRELVLFAPQNLLRDPPFSKLNLISCRNLLIYIDRLTQERVLQTFHFALKPGGYLFLGSSESAEGLGPGFVTIDKKSRIYQRDKSEALVKVPPSAAPVGWAPVPLPQSSSPAAPSRGVVPSFSELHYRMLEAFAPPSVLIDENYEIVHISEHAGRYLQMTGGEPSRNLLRILHPDLQHELRSLLIEGSQVGQASRRVSIAIDGQESLLEVSVRTVTGTAGLSGFALVMFQEVERRVVTAPINKNGGTETGTEALLLIVEEQLRQTRDQLRATVEEYETSTEELKASNEELQAMNEELRSASEELETGKEELQSLNEELSTLNTELKEKVEEVSHANSDLQNLMASTRIATLFVDRSLRVKRYTPSLQEIFNIIPTDIGRPLTHVTHNLASDNLAADAEKVLEDLQTLEREVVTKDGRWYILRSLPYRTTDHKITGVVITFTDIQERKNTEEILRAKEERLRLLVDSSRDYAIMTLDSQGKFVTWNPASESMFGYSAVEVIGQPFRMIFTEEDKAAGQDQKELSTAERNGKAVDERWHVRKDGTRLYLSGVMVRIDDSSGKGFAKIARDLTEEHRAKTELARAKDELEVRVRERTEELATANAQLRQEIVEHTRLEQRRLELVRRLVGTQEEERRRISRELHDQLGQLLTGLRLRLERLQKEAGSDVATKTVEELLESARQLEAEIDYLAWELRPSMLDDLGLQATLENYAREWSEHSGVKTTFHSQRFGSRRLSPLLETNLYRIAQEALNNVAKHSQAAKVEIILEPRENDVVLIVEDDGRGFVDDGKSETAGRKLGLAGLHERAALMNGTIEIESSEGKGTTVFVRIPMQAGGAD